MAISAFSTAADWKTHVTKAMKIGSYDHKKLFCRSLMDSHTQSSRDLHWPVLDSPDFSRIQSIPFWAKVWLTQYAVTQATSAFALTIKDPLVKEAIALQAEEQKHFSAAIKSLMQTYDILTPGLPPLKIRDNFETAFIDAGYQKCLDVFLANGLLEATRRANFIPEVLAQRFDLLLEQQMRHCIFFVNWMAYRKIKLNRRWSEARIIPALWNRSGTLVRLIAAFSEKDEDERPLSTQWMTKFTAVEFLNLCLLEHDRRLQGFDPALLRPQFSPNLAKLTCEALKVWPQRRASPTIDALKL